MSDKKFDFLNNPITCTVTTVAWPKGAAPSKKCLCFEGRPSKSYRRVENKDSDCMFQAVELARILSQKNVGKTNDDASHDLNILLTKQRSVKQMQLQYLKLQKIGAVLKNKVIASDWKNTGGFDITFLIEVLFISIIKIML